MGGYGGGLGGLGGYGSGLGGFGGGGLGGGYGGLGSSSSYGPSSSGMYGFKMQLLMCLSSHHQRGDVCVGG